MCRETEILYTGCGHHEHHITRCTSAPTSIKAAIEFLCCISSEEHVIQQKKMSLASLCMVCEASLTNTKNGPHVSAPVLLQDIEFELVARQDTTRAANLQTRQQKSSSARGASQPEDHRLHPTPQLPEGITNSATNSSGNIRSSHDYELTARGIGSKDFAKPSNSSAYKTHPNHQPRPLPAPPIKKNKEKVVEPSYVLPPRNDKAIEKRVATSEGLDSNRNENEREETPLPQAASAASVWTNVYVYSEDGTNVPDDSFAGVGEDTCYGPEPDVPLPTNATRDPPTLNAVQQAYVDLIPSNPWTEESENSFESTSSGPEQAQVQSDSSNDYGETSRAATEQWEEGEDSDDTITASRILGGMDEEEREIVLNGDRRGGSRRV